MQRLGTKVIEIANRGIGGQMFVFTGEIKKGQRKYVHFL